MKRFAFIISLVGLMAVASCKDLKSLNSICQVGDDEYLYEMEYYGDYDLDEVINADIDGNQALLDYATQKIGRGLIKTDSNGCTSFQVKSDNGTYLFGRNYDMFKNPTLVLHTKPSVGYASVSTCDLSHLGFSMEKIPDSFKNKVSALAAVYAPMDGMNEKGLCVSIMALPRQAAYQESGHHKVGTSIVMRLWLDRCASVSEALAMLDTLDVCHDQKSGSGYHYMIADASGDCAVVEFDLNDGWKTMVTRKSCDSTYMCCTNHLLAEKYYTESPDERYGNPHSKSWWRYGAVRSYMQQHGGTLTLDQAQECLENVHWVDLVWENGMIENTQWSNVYDPSTLTLHLRHWNTYSVTHTFPL